MPDHDSNNMTPLISAEVSVECLDPVRLAALYPLLHCGYDTLEWSVKITAAEAARLEAQARRALAQNGDIQLGTLEGTCSYANQKHHFYRIELNEIPFVLLLPGANRWKNGMQVLLGARGCLQHGAPEQALLEMLAVTCFPELTAGELERRLKLSRVDVAADLLIPETEFVQLCDYVAIRDPMVVTRARDIKSHNFQGQPTGFVVDAPHTIMLRVYDKGEQAQRKGNWSLWSHVYGRGDEYKIPRGSVVMRVEWQLRGQFLRSRRVAGLPVRTLEELEGTWRDIAAYLCRRWFRFAALPFGKNKERLLLPPWAAVAEAFAGFGRSPMTSELRLEVGHLVPGDPKHLGLQVLGCLGTVAAVQGHLQGLERPLSFEEVVRWLFHQRLERGHEIWDARAAEKYKQLGRAA